ncbi:MAG: Yip1 family protein, partial [Vicinamibacterales bacterium]
LLEPDAFDCVQCGRHITLDEMVLSPAEGVADHQTKVGSNPWLERSRTGRFKGWWATIVQAMMSPHRLAQGTPETSSLGQAWWFAIVTSAVTIVISMVPAMCLGLALPLFMPQGQAGAPPAALLAAAMAAGVTFGVVFGFVFLLVLAWMWALVTHLLLRISGSGHGPLRVTLQSILYSSGTIVLSAVPCVGNVAMVWWIVSAVLMVKESHDITGIRATFTVLAGPVVAMVLFIALYMGMIATAFVGAAGMGTTVPAQLSTQSTQTVLTVLVRYAAANGNRGPAHALQLVLDPGLREQDFIDPYTATIPMDVPVGRTTLADLAFDGPDERPAVIEQAAAALPDGVVAHRVGDFVFTYHGAVLDGRAPGLWLVVMTPDPGTVQIAGSMPVVVGRADGTTLLIPLARFTARFNQQNHLRAAQGLPPLPYPPTLTHESPAVADPDVDPW